MDQLIAATISAHPPTASMGASPKFAVRLTRTATPPTPTPRATANRIVNCRVFKTAISEIAMNTGIVAIITAAIPEGTRRSAQNSNP